MPSGVGECARGWQQLNGSREGSMYPTWIHFVEEVLPSVHPDFGRSCGILIDNLGHAPRKRVRRLVTKHVTHVGTGQNLQLTPTLPHLGTKT